MGRHRRNHHIHATKLNNELEKSNLPDIKKPKTRVVLDANFLFVPSQFKVDIFEELGNLLNRGFEAVVLSSTQRELEGLAESKSLKVGMQAKLGLQLAERCSFVSVEKSVSETYDDVIVRVAADWKCVVATNDRELRRRLRAVGVPVVFLRQKCCLSLEGSV
jgi:rRNA-processing protein FCF1